MIETACGLDCYDGCKIVFDEGKIKGDASSSVGNGALCALVNKSINDAPRIEKPRVDGVEVSMNEAMEAVKKAFEAKNTLLWRGSGNVGVMQEVSDLFMEKIQATLTKGSLCDGAGEAGILEGRGVNKTLPLEEIAKADTVVVWGRNLTVTNAHILPFLEGKKLVVIDPVRTEIAKKADYFLQIQPRSDYYVAIMLARFLFMEDSQDTQWLEEFAPEFEDFEDFTREYRIKSILSYIGTDLGQMGHVLNYLRGQKVVFLVGTGVQKYSTGSYVLHAIDSLATMLGLFGKEGSGVSYLGNSKLGFTNPFEVKTSRVSKVLTPFANFATVLVQGGNPAESMPDSALVKEALEAVENLIYFGLYENETSQRAKIVIPAKNFFEKDDIRLNYGHNYISKMNTIKSNDFGMSEYDFTAWLFDAFGFEGLESEAYYLDAWLDQCQKEGQEYLSPAYEALPYSDGFGKDGGDEFEFIEDYDDDFINTKRFTKYRKESKNKKADESLWLLSIKSKHALNTQFKRSQEVQIHPNKGYEEGQKVRLYSEYGEAWFMVKLNEDLREDCVLLTSNSLNLNHLTPSIVSEEGESACFQEVRVRIEG